MVIKKLKTEPLAKKEPLSKESVFQKITRLRVEKEADEKAAAKQKLIDDAKEKKRMESIVIPYIENLEKQLREKESHVFWTFPDRSGFKKIRTSHKELQKTIYEDIKKYADRKVLAVRVIPHNDSWSEKHGVYLNCAVSVYNIDKKGRIIGDNKAGCLIGWKLEDFKISKFSFKLLERIIDPIEKKKYICNAVIGIPLAFVLKNLEELGYNFDDVLSPLAGV